MADIIMAVYFGLWARGDIVIFLWHVSMVCLHGTLEGRVALVI